MPKTISFEGRQITVPDDATDVEIAGIINAPMQRKSAPSTLDVATNAIYKGSAGIPDTFLNTPQNVINLAKMGYGSAATALGRSDLAPDIQPPPDYVQTGLRKLGLIKDIGDLTAPQRLLDTTLQAATGGAVMPAASLSVMAANAVKSGAAGLVGQGTTEVTGNPVAGMTAAMATPAGITSIAQQRQRALMEAQQRNALRDANLRAAQEQGYVTTPGSVTPSVQNRLIERLAGKTRTEQGMAANNQETTDRLARQAVGLPDNTPLSSQAMQQIRRDEYTLGYQPLTNLGQVPTDAAFTTALNNVAAQYTGAGRSFPGAVPAPVTTLVQNFSVPVFNAGDAIAATRSLRTQSNTNMRTGDPALGLAQRSVSNALEDQIERFLVSQNNTNASQMLDQFRASRQRMAISHSIEDAIQEGSGHVNAKRLAADLQRTGPGKLTGELETIAQFANQFPRVNLPSASMGTPAAGTYLGQGLAASIGAGTGALFANAPGAIAGMVLPGAASAAARGYLSSPMAQRRAIPNYAGSDFMAQNINNPTLRAALLGLPMLNNNLAPTSQNALSQ